MPRWGRLSYRSVPDPQFSAACGLLDAAAGPLHPQAIQTLLAAVDAGWADPRRLYREARVAGGLLEQARATIAADLQVPAQTLSFHLGGAGAALAAGLDGLLWPARRRGARVVASAVEHSSILIPSRYAAAQAAEPRLLAEVPVDGFGAVLLPQWAGAVAEPGTAVAALQYANGEVGTLQPVDVAYQHSRAAGVPLLVDATASLGRYPAPRTYDVLAGDAATVAGPPLGLLVVPETVPFRRAGPPREAEFGRADAPVWVPLALCAAEAWQQAAAQREADAAQAHALTERIRVAAAAIPDFEFVGDPDHRLPHVVTLSALFTDGETLVTELDRRALAVASGSACTASTLEPSHVLAAMGVLTHGNVRITLPWAAVAPDREAAVERLIALLPEVIASVRAGLGASGL